MSEPSGKSKAWVWVITLVLVAGGVLAFSQIPTTKPYFDQVISLIPKSAGGGDVSEPTTDRPTTTTPTQQPTTSASGLPQPGRITPPTAGQDPLNPTEPQTDTPAGGGIGSLLNPFAGAAKATAEAGPDNGPVKTLRKLMNKLHARDIIGAEYFVSENGKKLSLNGTTGIHKILLKYTIDTKTFDEIGYDDAKVTGQTTWVPIYSRLDPNDGKKRMLTAYIIVANRGDGWKVDDLYDAR